VISILVFWLFQNHAKQVLVDQQRVHQLESINQIAKVISAHLNMDKLVKAVTDAGLNLTHAQAGAFFQASSEDGVIRIYTTSSGDVSETIQIERPTNVPLFDLTFLEKTTVRSEDVSLHPLYPRRSPIYPLFGNLQKIRS